MTVESFRIETPQPVLDRIRARLESARIGYAPDDDGQWQYGMDARYLSELVGHWRDSYDWRAEEAALNTHPQYRAEIDGVPIQFYHVRAPGSDRLPILLTHGWPGSVVEFQDVIPRLVTAGFDVVVPSLPGFGWSGRPRRPIGLRAVAAMWRKLMVEALGYSRFYAQGGDFGWLVTSQLALDHADVVEAIHLNFIMPPPPGADPDPDLAEYWNAVRQLMATESGYHQEHATKPQTIGLALHDNPVGWAAWVVEKFWRWGDTHGEIESRFSKDHLITNLMSYLVTDNVMSSIWMYYGSAQERRATGRATVPTAFAHFPGEFYPMPSRELASRAFNIQRWSTMAAGGHFAAMEEPSAFSDDVIAFFCAQS